MNELMTQLQPIIMNAAVVILTAIGSYVGLKVKTFIKEKADTDTKKKVVETTCKYVEQIYKDLDGASKLEKAKDSILEQLNEKGVSISELELDVLIEATVNGFKDATVQGEKMDIFVITKTVVEWLAVLGVVVEVTPIKVSPLKWIGRRLNSELREDVQNIEKRISDLEQKQVQKDIEAKRKLILDFANSLRQDKKHTVEEYENVIRTIDDYILLCEKYNIKNGYINIQAKYINDTYYMLSKTGKFKTCMETGELL